MTAKLKKAEQRVSLENKLENVHGFHDIYCYREAMVDIGAFFLFFLLPPLEH